MALMDFTSCPCSGANLPRYLYPAVLAILSDAPCHGYVVLKALSGSRFFRWNPPDQTGVYRTLGKMENEGLLQSVHEKGEGQKKVYAITEKGRCCLMEWIRTLTAHQAYLAEFTAYLRERVGTVEDNS